MARKIRIQKNFIPIEFENEKGEVLLELRFDKSDEAIDRLYKQDEVIKELVDKVDETNNEMEETKKFVSQCFDSVLGDGAFEKVYAINPSCLIILQYFIQSVVMIREELDDFEGAAAIEQYLQG